MACIARKIISGIKKDVGKSNQQPVLQSLKLIGVAFYIFLKIAEALGNNRMQNNVLRIASEGGANSTDATAQAPRTLVRANTLLMLKNRESGMECLDLHY